MIYLNWWPIFRDAVSYIITILILFVVIADGQVYWYPLGMFNDSPDSPCDKNKQLNYYRAPNILVRVARQELRAANTCAQVGAVRPDGGLPALHPVHALESPDQRVGHGEVGGHLVAQRAARVARAAGRKARPRARNAARERWSARRHGCAACCFALLSTVPLAR